ncbi:MAG TPA: phosphonopyruvate decarboxylase [Gemmatimonadaceae bacterium]
MIEPRSFFEAVSRAGVAFFAGVPDSLLKEFCAFMSDVMPAERHVIACNEGNALAVAAGAQLATGSVPLVYLQNSGFGNLVNPLISLTDPEVYGLPIILLIGWRGEPGTKDEPQHMVQGRVQEGLLRTLGVPSVTMGPESNPAEVASWAVQTARARGGPVAILVRKGTFASYRAAVAAPKDPYPTREEIIEVVLERVDERDVVVATTGMTSREVFEVRERRGEGHGQDFLTVGSMGHASAIALGLAAHLPDRHVWCLDGDGAALMHLGAMTTLGTSGLVNVVHVLLNNGAHDSVGGQPTVGRLIDFQAIARASRYRFTARAGTIAELRRALGEEALRWGPSMLEVWVRKGARSNLGRPTTAPMQNKAALQRLIAR